MKKPFIILMCGMPASGKSTAAKKFTEWYNQNFNHSSCIVVSRDEIRFNFLRRNDIDFDLLKQYDTTKYFSKENEVFNTFIQMIKNNISFGFNVIADATHINWRSRKKIITALQDIQNKVNIFVWVINTPLDVCLERNSFRTGITKVPKRSMLSLFNSKDIPSLSESNIDKIFIDNYIYQEWEE